MNVFGPQESTVMSRAAAHGANQFALDKFVGFHGFDFLLFGVFVVETDVKSSFFHGGTSFLFVGLFVRCAPC